MILLGTFLNVATVVPDNAYYKLWPASQPLTGFKTG